MDASPKRQTVPSNLLLKIKAASTELVCTAEFETFNPAVGHSGGSGLPHSLFALTRFRVEKVAPKEVVQEVGILRPSDFLQIKGSLGSS